MNDDKLTAENYWFPLVGKNFGSWANHHRVRQSSHLLPFLVSTLNLAKETTHQMKLYPHKVVLVILTTSNFQYSLTLGPLLSLSIH